MSEKEIIDLFYFKFLDVPLLSRMHSVAEYFIDQVETLRDRDLSDEEREEVIIKGEGGTIPNTDAEINIRSAGTAARFMTVLLAVCGGNYVLNSS